MKMRNFIPAVLLPVLLTQLLSVSLLYSDSSNLCGSKVTEDTKLDQDLNCSANGIAIGANNITLDCNGHSITGSAPDKENSSYNGITLKSRNHVTVENCKVSGFYNGIALFDASENTFQRNEVEDNFQDGIMILNSSKNTFRQNKGCNNWYDIELIRGSDNALVDNDFCSVVGF